MTKPLQVFMSAEDLAHLDAWSRKRGWTKSQTVRTAVRALTRPREADPLLAASGMIEGLPHDMSARFDRYLEETFVAQPSRQPKARQANSRLRR